MGRQCSVCEDPQREAIDLELASGRSRRAIAAEYRPSESAVRRHGIAHLEPGLHRAAMGRESLRLGAMVDKLVQLSEDAGAILAEALSAAGDRRVALSAMKESREIITMIGRLVSPDSAETIEEAQRLVSALGRVLPRHMDAATDLAEELRTAGSTDLADAISDLVAEHSHDEGA